MHFPVTIYIGRLAILLHACTEVLAFVIGYRYYLWIRRREHDHITSINRLYIIIGAAFGALIGSRLLGGLEDPLKMINSDRPFLYLYQNKTIVGGFLGGLAGVEGIKKIIGEKRNSGDMYVFPILLALIIGRIGCFSMGVYEETYGLPTGWITGIYLGDDQLRHPVALYEIAFLAFLWFALKQTASKYTLAEGALFKLFMITYLGFRLLLDFIKPHFTWSIGLSSIQIACLIGLLYYCPYISHPKKLLAPYARTPIHLL